MILVQLESDQQMAEGGLGGAQWVQAWWQWVRLT
jgi:hypothetical protein